MGGEVMVDIAIIGGGASGLVAAIHLARQGKEVVILERNPRIGKKILATGNGRCNYTNVDLVYEDYNHPTFVQDVFQQFSGQDTLSFFEDLGIVPKVEKAGKTYPYSEQASSIVDVLLYEIEQLGVKVLIDTLITDVKKKTFFELYSNQKLIIQAKKVLLATGGKAMPQSGSDGIGYHIAKSFGHTIEPLFPTIGKVVLDFPYLKHLDGLKLETQVDLVVDNEIIQSEFGDTLFTSYGISGPTILDCSRKVGVALQEKKTCHFEVALVNHLDKNTLYQRFMNRSQIAIDQALIGLIHKRLIPVVLGLSGIEPKNLFIQNIPPQKITQLIQLLLKLELKITGLRGFEEAQATAGGISIHEIDSHTLESKKVPGLYFSGEVIDIDGRCGGFNLQWAWSSGIVAASAIARSLQ